MFCLVSTTYTFGTDWTWQAANLNYILPLGLSLFTLRWALDNLDKISLISGITAILIGIILGGFNELSTITTIIVIFIIGISVSVTRKKIPLSLVLMMIGTCVGAWIEVHSPGNGIRSHRAGSDQIPLSQLPHQAWKNLHLYFYEQYPVYLSFYWPSIWIQPTLNVSPYFILLSSLGLVGISFGAKSSIYINMAALTLGSGHRYLLHALFPLAVIPCGMVVIIAFLFGRVFPLLRYDNSRKLINIAASLFCIFSFTNVFPTFRDDVVRAKSVAQIWDDNDKKMKLAVESGGILNNYYFPAWWGESPIIPDISWPGIMLDNFFGSAGNF
jgi:hypothetical protein